MIREELTHARKKWKFPENKILEHNMSDLSRVNGEMTARAAVYSDDEKYETTEHQIHNCAQEKKRREEVENFISIRETKNDSLRL